jgi:hypothetical protein
MSNLVHEFEIWVELDEYEKIEEQDFDDDFCNAIITFIDGSQIGLNIWSEKYFYNQVKNLEWIDKQIAVLPDIVVKKFDALSIRQAITSLVSKHNWLEGRGFPMIS